MYLLASAALGLQQHHRSCREHVTEEAGSGEGQEAKRAQKGQESLHPSFLPPPLPLRRALLGTLLNHELRIGLLIPLIFFLYVCAIWIRSCLCTCVHQRVMLCVFLNIMAYIFHDSGFHRARSSPMWQDQLKASSSNPSLSISQSLGITN